MSDIVSQGIYVYTLAYPESMGGAIFYVGKGKNGRIKEHEAEAKKGVQSAKCNAIREIWAASEEVVRTKVAHFDNEHDAHLYEWGLMNMTTYAENLTNINRGTGLHYNGDNAKYRKTEDKIPCNLLGECVSATDDYTSETKIHPWPDICKFFRITEMTLWRWCHQDKIVPHINPTDARRRYLDNNQFIYLSARHNRVQLTETETILLREIEQLKKRIEKLERKAK